MNTKDYIYCKTCKIMVDFWKYNHNIEDTGHDECNWRFVTNLELEDCISDCKANKCFEENILGSL